MKERATKDIEIWPQKITYPVTSRMLTGILGIKGKTLFAWEEADLIPRTPATKSDKYFTRDYGTKQVMAIIKLMKLALDEETQRPLFEWIQKFDLGKKGEIIKTPSGYTIRIV